MAALSESALLLAWEEGMRRPALERPLVLLEAAGERDDAEALGIGRRDTELLALREQTFGLRVDAVTDCSACGEALELSFDTAELKHDVETSEGDPHVLPIGGVEVRFHLVTTADLVAVSELGDLTAAREALLERCVLEPEADRLTAQARRAIVDRMAELDPLATIELDLRCPVCEATGRVVFDVASFLWAELDAAVRRTLEDVHVFASAYGWREQDVLALGPERRRLYLELVG